MDKELLGMLAVLIAFVSYALYLWAIFKGKVKPHAFSWLIWGLLTAIGFAAQIHDHAGPGAWVTGISAAITFFITCYAFFKHDRAISRKAIGIRLSPPYPLSLCG